MKPRVAFLGLGWIGLNRLQAVVADGACDVVAVADASAEARERAVAASPGARAMATLEDLLGCAPDGIVIATPSALHAPQCLQALQAGVAVFCQKPLARTAAETQAIVGAAQAADRLLGCDFSYRHTEAMRRVRNCVVEGELGRVYAADLVFHNAWGPDKAWFRDPQLAGGGCAIDLGVHLVDLALWTLGFPTVEAVHGRLYAQGRLLSANPAEVEDYAVAELQLAGGIVARIACSWNLHAGRDAVIEAHFHGTRGGASMVNVNGSFYDFSAARFEGTRRTPLAEPPDAWGGRAVVDWAHRLAGGAGYLDSIAAAVQVARVLDRIYGR